ncbi:leucyl/phenylalanyl-tRNA--protein transferase [Kordiimonas aquimaris]|uniref:leucyl/phenylalanyl-tRNA--protein transferase n=1 Tax=Kordiimonas aquimaris TaxID=707591 RepID=UPI0021D00F5E|nr:leucyl/phenylalanyl-tRNA--protein transferase [Kordiimonas aquimaris]
MTTQEITPELILNAYASGIFPMADSRTDNDMFWVDPPERGILPLDSFHVSRSLKKAVRHDIFDVTANKAFQQVVESCAQSYKDREQTWISKTIEELYCELHRYGFAHSIECWLNGKLVGGLYGVSLQGAFFGESMFHIEPNASKVALVHLVARLKFGGFELLDTQFGTEHLAQFGVIEIPRKEYRTRLDKALANSDASFSTLQPDVAGERALQLITQIS